MADDGGPWSMSSGERRWMRRKITQTAQNGAKWRKAAQNGRQIASLGGGRFHLPPLPPFYYFGRAVDFKVPTFPPFSTFSGFFLGSLVGMGRYSLIESSRAWYV